jgi:hypothetical protein
MGEFQVNKESSHRLPRMYVGDQRQRHSAAAGGDVLHRLRSLPLVQDDLTR